MSLVAMVYPGRYFPDRNNVLVAILHNGGSVAVTHGGIEVSQGINTKVAQVVARELGVDLSMVSIKPTNSLTTANGAGTGGSLTSELNCYGGFESLSTANKGTDASDQGENAARIRLENLWNNTTIPTST